VLHDERKNLVLIKPITFLDINNINNYLLDQNGGICSRRCG
jgi:hypothetical protein